MTNRLPISHTNVAFNALHMYSLLTSACRPANSSLLGPPWVYHGVSGRPRGSLGSNFLVQNPQRFREDYAQKIRMLRVVYPGLRDSSICLPQVSSFRMMQDHSPTPVTSFLRRSILSVYSDSMWCHSFLYKTDACFVCLQRS